MKADFVMRLENLEKIIFPHIFFSILTVNFAFRGGG